MSSDLVLLALDVDDGSEIAVLGEVEAKVPPGPSPIQAMSQQVEQTEHSQVSTPKEAMSQHVVAAAGDEPTGEGKKKKRKAAGETEPSVKVAKTTPKLQEAPGIDGVLHCIFVHGECIPLWPQYKLAGTDTMFIKVAPHELWLAQFTTACRKHALRGYEQTKDKKVRFGRNLAKVVCREMLLEFGRVLKVARKSYKKVPDALPVNLHGCELVAFPCARQLSVVADVATARLIQTEFHKEVTQLLAAELQAMSQPAALAEASMGFSTQAQRAGVRDKIHWIPEKCKWGLRVNVSMAVVRDYCKDHSLCLEVESVLSGDEFLRAQQEAFYHACLAWNALDKSSKPRIKAREPFLSRPVVELSHKMAAISQHADSEEEGDSDASSDEPEVAEEGSAAAPA